MRLTTNDPQDNVQTALNLFYVKDKQTWVRGGGPGSEYKDVPLYDYIRRAIKLVATCLPMFDELDDMKLSEVMTDWAMDGNCSLEGLIGTLYTAAWAFAELREKLMDYEDAKLDPEAAAQLLKKNCAAHIDEDLCGKCHFAVVGEPCPLDTGTAPEGWRV